MKTKRSSKKKGLDIPTSIRTLSKEVSNKLTKQIINGVYPAGAKLPTEREMAVAFGVARHVVREALKRVETLRLIKIRQGSGAVVQDFLSSGGIELVDLLLVKEDGKVDRDLLNDIIEFHEVTCVYAVKLAAERITTAELQELEKLIAEYAKHVRDPEMRSVITLKISELIVKACRNKYIKLLFNSVTRTTVIFSHVFEIPMSEDSNILRYLERLLEALRSKDADMAGLITLRGFEENKMLLIQTLEGTRLTGATRPTF